jgi:hypothetical protein
MYSILVTELTAPHILLYFSCFSFLIKYVNFFLIKMGYCRAGRVAQVVESLPSKCEASTTKKKKTKTEIL